MQNVPVQIRQLMLIVLMAVVYMLTARLGFMLALPPGNVSALWPPSGIALAAVLLFGRSLTIGIWLGSFLINYWSLSGTEGMLVAAAIACGSSLQALLAQFILNRVLPTRIPSGQAVAPKLAGPASSISVLKFVAVTGLAATAAPSVGVTSLCLAQYAQWPEYYHLWWTWWLGDFAGILTFAPALLVLGWTYRKQPMFEPLLFPLATLWFGLSLIGFFVVFHLEGREALAQLQVRANQAQSNLQRIASNSLNTITALKAFFDASEMVEPNEFDRFVEPMLTQNPELLALEWAQRVSASERGQVEAQWRAQGHINSNIYELDNAGNPIPASLRDEYFPLVYIRPLTGNSAVFGLDLAFEPMRRVALLMARDQQIIVATAPISLIQGKQSRMGTLLYAPVFKKNDKTALGNNDMPSLKGYAVAVLRFQMLLDATMAGLHDRSLQLSLFDISADKAIFLADTLPGDEPRTLSQLTGSDFVSHDIDFAGRHWRLITQANAGDLVHESWRSWVLLMVGLIMSILMTFYIDIRRRGERLQQASEAYWQQLFNGAPEAIVVVDAEGRMLRCNTMMQQLFGYGLDELRQQFVEILLPVHLHNHHRELRQHYMKSPSHQLIGQDRELFGRHKDGNEFPIDVVLSPIQHDDQTQVIVAIREISARKKYVAEIRQLNVNLQELNAGLESRVKERTQLLENEIERRTNVEQGLQEVHQQLQHTIAELESRNHEVNLLRELNEMLDTCKDEPEAYETINHFLPYILQDSSGSLHMCDNGGSTLKQVAGWGELMNDPKQFRYELQDCWGLRRGRLYLVSTPEAVPCAHVTTGLPIDFISICAPLIHNGETFGLLHVRYSKNSAQQVTQDKMVASVAEQLVLVLANLQLRESLRQQATRDPLTNLYNRRFMQETLNRELSRAHRNKQSFVVVLIDIDHFKAINDTYGHAGGDHVLRTIANELSGNLRSSDVACRYGGEEFVLLLPDASSEGAFARVEQLRVRVAGIELTFDEHILRDISFSAGLAVYPLHGADTDSLIAAADKALYGAKHSGRNRTHIAGDTPA